MVRWTVCFAECLYAGRFMVDGVPAERAMGRSPKERLSSARALIDKKAVPVVVDPKTEILRAALPVVLVDDVMSKRNTGTNKDQAEVVIGLGPGFCAGEDAHAVIETLRGHYNGRVILEGSAAANTGSPGPINGYVTERMLYAPVAGRIEGPSSHRDHGERRPSDHARGRPGGEDADPGRAARHHARRPGGVRGLPHRGRRSPGRPRDVLYHRRQVPCHRGRCT